MSPVFALVRARWHPRWGKRVLAKHERGAIRGRDCEVLATVWESRKKDRDHWKPWRAKLADGTDLGAFKGSGEAGTAVIAAWHAAHPQFTLEIDW